MKSDIEQRIISFLPKQQVGFRMCSLIVLSFVLGVVVHYIFYVITAILLVMTVAFIINNRKTQINITKVLTNFDTRKSLALQYLYNEIRNTELKVLKEEHKSQRIGKEGHQSKMKAREHRETLTKLMGLKDLIIEYHKEKDEDPFGVIS
jgi:hypothetical protein